MTSQDNSAPDRVGPQSLQHLLRGLRETRGRTLRQVARDLELDPAYLSRMERGEKPSSDEFLRRASDYYAVPQELLALSRGQVPVDVITILQRHPEVLEELRSRYGA